MGIILSSHSEAKHRLLSGLNVIQHILLEVLEFIAPTLLCRDLMFSNSITFSDHRLPIDPAIAHRQLRLWSVARQVRDALAQGSKYMW